MRVMYEDPAVYRTVKDDSSPKNRTALAEGDPKERQGGNSIRACRRPTEGDSEKLLLSKAVP